MQRPGLISAIVVTGLALAAAGRAQQEPLLGRWEGTVEGPQGKRQAVLSLEKDAAGGYAGTITGMRGDVALRDIKVTVDTVSAESQVETAQGSLRVKYSFVRQGTDLKGKSEAEFGGQTFTANFELKRSAAASPAPASAPQATPSPEASRRPGRQSPPQPTQKQSLDYFSGRWSFRWVGRESALTPGGVLEGTMVIKPVPEGVFLEGRLEGRSKTGPMGERLLLGFDDANKALVLLEQRGGAQTLSLGDWTSPIAIRFKVAPFQAGGRRLRLNRTLAVVAAHSFTLTEELSEDGGPFVRLGNAVFARAVEAAESPGKD